MSFRERIAGRPSAIATSLVLVLLSYVLFNVVLYRDGASSTGWLLQLVRYLQYPEVTSLGIVMVAFAILFVMWAVRDRSIRTWFPAGLAVVALHPAIMAGQDLATRSLMPGSTPPVWLHALSGLMYGILAAGFGTVLAVLAATLIGIAADRTSAST